MAYSEKSAARLAALHEEIEARKEHEFAAPTYRDAAALAEIRQTVFNQLESEHEHDRDTVEDSIAVLRYLAENYENMGRTACALPLRKKDIVLHGMRRRVWNISRCVIVNCLSLPIFYIKGII